MAGEGNKTSTFIRSLQGRVIRDDSSIHKLESTEDGIKYTKGDGTSNTLSLGMAEKANKDGSNLATPDASDNSTKIATTAFVKAQNYTTATGHTHNYLPLTGGTLTGDVSGLGISMTDRVTSPIINATEKVIIGSKVSLKYNASTESLDFIFT